MGVLGGEKRGGGIAIAALYSVLFKDKLKFLQCE